MQDLVIKTGANIPYLLSDNEEKNYNIFRSPACDSRNFGDNSKKGKEKRNTNSKS